MRSINPDQFARIMALPERERSDLLEFLGATPVHGSQIDRLIAQVSWQHKRQVQRSEARADHASA